MTFSSLEPGTIAAFLRHESLDVAFDLARTLDATAARRLLKRPLAPRPPFPLPAVLEEILSASPGRGPAPRLWRATRRRRGTGSGSSPRGRSACRFPGRSAMRPRSRTAFGAFSRR